MGRLATLALALLADPTLIICFQTPPQPQSQPRESRPGCSVLSRRAVLATLPLAAAATAPALAETDSVVERDVASAYLALPLSERISAMHAELSPLAPLDYALQKQREKQEKCYDDGECADREPYYAIVCDRDDDQCLARKRRLAAQELANFRIDPTSSPVFLVFATLPLLQWSIAGARIAIGIYNRNKPPPPPPRRRVAVEEEAVTAPAVNTCADPATADAMSCSA